MKKLIYQIVFISIMTFMYYLYSSWIESLQKPNLDSTIYQIFSPFKLIILGVIFSIVYAAIKNLLFSRFVNIKSYKKNLKNYILYDFEICINFIGKLKGTVKDDDITQAKKLLKEFQSLSYRPHYLVDLIEVITSKVLAEESLVGLENACTLVEEKIKNNFEKEKQRKINKKNETFLDFKMVNDYYSKNSWNTIDYLLEVNGESNLNKWKISSLYISKIYSALNLSIILNLVMFTFTGLGLYYSNITLGNVFFYSFILSIFLTTMVIYNIWIIIAAKKYNLTIYWLNMLVLYFFIALIFINIVINIVFFPKYQIGEEWYKSNLIQFLMSLLYIVLSTMLLVYSFAQLISMLEEKKYNVLSIIYMFVIPLSIFILTAVINFMIVFKTLPIDLYFANFSILFIYWTCSWIFISYFTNN
ncbi:hypothetical protein [Spiroplasma apis]|uniref:Transmembrane protein n=1 Tax=Spiroplasma apis B31 TaxID=1276258 RepID=V5RKM3_SPIAP|nr:hypothetical protein [Spiroplasma apis]AHB36365.1 hypothetical protein SAPIS_v1c05200 [Spiroplasma apis B31]